MSFEWLKRYLPRGLYGRAFLILVLPVVTLQLVVSVVFIQRHFEEVTRQMTGEVAQAMNVALARDNAFREVMLDFDVRPVTEAALPTGTDRRWFDFSAIVVHRTLSEELPNFVAARLPDDQDVFVYLRRDDALLEVRFDRDRASASNPHQLLVYMIFFGALMTAIAYLYLRNQLRPITRLADAAQAFGRGRHAPYAPSGAIEVRNAGHAFLDMRARIERQIEQRTMMLSGVSHDLRTPITRLKLGLSMLDDADQAPLLADVAEMERLIDAFLDFARGNAEAGAPEPTDPVALVTRVVEDAQRAGRAVTMREAEGAGEVMLRPVAIRRALENLIGNAVRYGTHCEVSVSLTKNALRLRVEDDGPGIDAESRDDAIRPFVRLDPARNQNRGSGVGLGLAIAADIARGHGGVLRLGDSETLGGLRADIVIAR
ncbi:two-component system, OmpR family, osmolarity sensor histidine kinase EnvZ [Roseivivax lentus]|uniref:histidine kinase n=1 Tax=Roseivivax lentus TaxID=633194 RepID=A0A1N7PWK1_9RHOB|nr:ATP-binding protein [Roseivivax lentus]SIT15043.1 two-component system, OmpR family, osmolarity sensor histidine kinase EnvZ [Roseivivax lentus]